MKLFKAHFSGIWIGGCGFVVAQDRKRAVELMNEEMYKEGLANTIDFEDYEEFVEIDLTKEKPYILFNGDY